MELDVKISGVSYRSTNKYSLRKQAATSSSSTFEVRIDDSHPEPEELSAVQIFYESTALLWGVIETVETPYWSSGYETYLCTITVRSGEGVLQNRIVAESYEGMYTHEIVQDLFDNYISEEGFTLGKISSSTQYYETYTPSYIKLSDSLDELAELIGFTYYISADKKFYFVSRNDFTQVTPPTHLMKLKKTGTIGDIRTVQYVQGASEDTTSQVRTVLWAANQTEQTLAYPLSVTPTATINGTVVGVGERGIDEEDTSKTFLWKSGSYVVSLNANATTQPATGDTVVFVYKGSYDILVICNNEQLISQIKARNGTSGKIEKVKQDSTLDNYQDAETLGQSLINEYGEAERTVECYYVGIELGLCELFNLWNLSLSDLGVSGYFAITETTITDRGDKFKINIKLKNKGYFSRYGTVFNIVQKSSSTATIFKNSSFSDSVAVSETYDFDVSEVPVYPSSSDGISSVPALEYPFYCGSED